VADAIKILGQSAPSAATATTLYTAPSSPATTAVVSKIFVCNQNTSAGVKIRIWVAVNAAADANKQYLYYDFPLDIQTTLCLTAGLTLGAGDLLRIQSDTGSVSFNAFGIENTSITDTPKVLGQNDLSAATAASVYTVPSSTACIVSSIFMCNRNVSSGATATTAGSNVDLWIQQNGASDTAKQYLFKTFRVGYSETLVVPAGIALAAGDVIRAQSSDASVSVNAFGMEMAA
jgi:hypothetical protein